MTGMVSSITAVVVVVPASGEAIMGLPETIAKEGECRCSVCLEAANDKLRMMPCSHSFHDLQLARDQPCLPLCRFPLPTEQQR